MENEKTYRMVGYLNNEDVPNTLVIPVFEEIKKYNTKDEHPLYLGLGNERYDSFKVLKTGETITYIDDIMFQMIIAPLVVKEGDKTIFGQIKDEQLFVASLDEINTYLNETKECQELQEKITEYKTYMKKLGTYDN